MTANAADLWGSDPHDSHWPTDDDPGVCVYDREQWPCDEIRRFDGVAELFATVAAAEKLCGIYFEIAERFIPAEEIRRIRDEKICEAIVAEKANTA